MTTRRMRNIDSEIVDSYAMQQQCSTLAVCVHTANTHTTTRTHWLCLPVSVCVRSLMAAETKRKVATTTATTHATNRGELKNSRKCQSTHTHIHSPLYPLPLSMSAFWFLILLNICHMPAEGAVQGGEGSIDAAHAMPGTYCTREQHFKALAFFPQYCWLFFFFACFFIIENKNS